LFSQATGKKRGFCPSCGARRIADSAALLVDEILPHQPMRQWVLSVPFPLRFLFAGHPVVMGKALGIVYRIATGPQQGRKVMTLQTLPDCGDDRFTTRVGHVAGFSLPQGTLS
jgi:hypothetical protein